MAKQPIKVLKNQCFLKRILQPEINTSCAVCLAFLKQAVLHYSLQHTFALMQPSY